VARAAHRVREFVGPWFKAHLLGTGGLIVRRGRQSEGKEKSSITGFSVRKRTRTGPTLSKGSWGGKSKRKARFLGHREKKLENIHYWTARVLITVERESRGGNFRGGGGAASTKFVPKKGPKNERRGRIMKAGSLVSHCDLFLVGDAIATQSERNQFGKKGIMKGRTKITTVDNI